MNEETTPDTGDPYCARVRLLLSMLIDGEATAEQQSEAEAHVACCDDCRGARAADLSVRMHLEHAFLALPSGELATRVARLVALDIRATRSTNRFLMISAAAAVLVAVTAGMISGGARRSAANGAPDSDLLGQARASTRFVVSAPIVGRGR